MSDSSVSEWHSRDLDSVIDARESSAVKEWRDDFDKAFHVMRDHWAHAVPVLAGMFGAKVKDKVMNFTLECSGFSC